MITGDIRSKVDSIWNTFWTGGISNPLTVIEQISYLLFIKRLDELQTVKEKQANQFGGELDSPVFTKDQDHLRWSRFKELEANKMFDVVSNEVFPFIKNMNGADGSAYARHMKDAIFMIQSPQLIAKVVDLIEGIPMEDRDTKGDLYEYLLSKLTTAGVNGQFRTPRHIIKMMVDMMKPKPGDRLCDPACGTGGFLVIAGEYIRRHHSGLFNDEKQVKRYNEEFFNGFDFDSTMLRTATMNLMLHGVEKPHIDSQDSLLENFGGTSDAYTLIMANPPFKGSLDYESTAKDLLSTVKTKKTELLFLTLMIRLLTKGGRCAVIVPDGVLFGSSNAHIKVRQILVEDHKLEAVISMPSGVFKPYAGVSTGVLIFTKTGSGGTDHVWFYDMQADGFSLDDKRTPLDNSNHDSNNIKDIQSRWDHLEKEHKRQRTDQSFFVSKDEIAGNKYDLSVNRYKEIVYDEIAYDPPKKILEDVKALEREIQKGLEDIEKMLTS